MARDKSEWRLVLNEVFSKAHFAAKEFKRQAKASQIEVTMEEWGEMRRNHEKNISRILDREGFDEDDFMKEIEAVTNERVAARVAFILFPSTPKATAWFLPFLSRAEDRMVKGLARSLPRTAAEMAEMFGQNWGSVWDKLLEIELVEFNSETELFTASPSGKAYVAARD